MAEEKSIGDTITDAFFNAFPLIKTTKDIVQTLDKSITRAKETRDFDERIKTAIDKGVSPEDKAIMKDLTIPIEGFVGTPEQELAHKIKLQTTNYENIALDVTDSSPENFNKAISMMGSEKDINKKLSAALAVTAIANQMTVNNMQSYASQARAALGIDHLGMQLQTMMAAEIRSPYNPKDGSHSIEVQTLIDKLSVLNSKVPELAKEYASMDPAIAAPLAAAQAVLKSLPVMERLEISRERMQSKIADINTVTDTEAKNYAMMTGKYDSVNWHDPQQVFRAKSTFYTDKEFQKLSQQHLLSIDDPLTARTLYAFSSLPTEKSRNFAIMHRIEADSLNVQDPNITAEERNRRKSKLDENMKLVKAVYSADLSKPEQNAINTQVNIEMSGAGTKEKDIRRKELETARKDTVLQQVLIQRFSSDVTRWKGMDMANPLVGQAINNVKKNTGKSSVPIEAFISEYLAIPSAATYRERLKQLQAYIYSSANVANDSAILPDISGEQIYNKAAPGTARIWLNGILGGQRG